MGTNSNAALWWAMLAGSWQSGEVEAAIFVGFTLEILRSAQNVDCPQPLDFPICVPKSRIPFDTINAKILKGKHKGKLRDPKAKEGARISSNSPGHANVIVYLPPIKDRSTEGLKTMVPALKFLEAFTPIGHCRV